MENIKKIVDVWELRVSIWLSTVLQILLILWPYLVRLSSSRPWLRGIWLFFYVAIDLIATLCLGIIFHVYMDPKQTDQHNKFLLAIWAPIILLHLAAHSTVTAISLEDNDMWVSHVFRFVFRFATASSIFAMAFKETRLRYPSTVLLIVSGFKFMERVWALKRGSMEELRMSTFREAGPFIRARHIIGALSRRIQAANNRGDLLLPAGAHHRINIPRPHPAPPHVPLSAHDSEFQTLCAAYKSFNKYKGLYVQNVISKEEHVIEDNGQPFRAMDINVATKLMKIELGFAYDFFYTKRAFLHSPWRWIFRLIAVLLLLPSALWALVAMKKQGFSEGDVNVTYVFVIVTLILEVVSFLESLSSNCTIVQVEGTKWRKIGGWVRGLRSIMSKTKTSRQSTNIKIGQFSLLSFCHADCQSWKWVKPVLNFLQLKELWDNFLYTRYHTLDDHAALRAHIFNRVTERLQEEDAANSSFTAPIGASVKRNLTGLRLANREEPPNEIIQKNLTREDLGECVIVWHLATEKCCRDLRELLPDLLRMAKCVSDYMLYLLAVQPSMLSKLTTAEVTSYKNACAAVTDSYSILDQGSPNSTGEDAAIVALLEDIHNILDEGSREQRNRRKAVRLVLDGFELAEELKELNEHNNNNNGDIVWDLVFQLWVDLLSFAAYHSRGEHHAKQLGSGGEFLTYVWLFMVHFIWETRYQVGPQNAGH